MDTSCRSFCPIDRTENTTQKQIQLHSNGGTYDCYGD